MKKFLFFLTVLTIAVSGAIAQISAFTYQGSLTDSVSPANGTYDLRFALYDSAIGSNVVAGPITNAPIRVNNGLFTTTVNFSAGVFSGADRWLEIGVRANGSAGAYQTLTPRQHITATPYAVRAAMAGN